MYRYNDYKEKYQQIYINIKKTRTFEKKLVSRYPFILKGFVVLSFSFLLFRIFNFFCIILYSLKRVFLVAIVVVFTDETMFILNNLFYFKFKRIY